MITKKIISSLFFFVLLLTIIIGISAYTFQIPICNSTINNSCINITSISPITNAPNGIMFWKDGYLYLTNDTATNYTIYNITNTNITYQNITYFYNISNGSSLTIIQNITANESIIRDWINSKLNSTFYNNSFYNRSDADITFAFKTEFNNLKNSLSTYAMKTDLDKYGYLLTINASGIDAINVNENGGLSTTWIVIIIINCVLTVVLMLFIIKMMMS